MNEASISRPVRFWNKYIAHTKGNEVLQAIYNTNSNYVSGGKPTYWPTDRRKKPDLLDFFIVKGIATTTYALVENVDDLSSDHSPVLLLILPLYKDLKNLHSLTDLQIGNNFVNSSTSD